jgi:predicted Rossmann-fold nucleotide-binding protein
VLDVGGFYSGLSGFLDHMVQEGFLRAAHRATMLSAAEPGALLDRLEAWEPVRVTKWLDLERS